MSRGRTIPAEAMRGAVALVIAGRQGDGSTCREGYYTRVQVEMARQYLKAGRAPETPGNLVEALRRLYPESGSALRPARVVLSARPEPSETARPG